MKKIIAALGFMACMGGLYAQPDTIIDGEGGKYFYVIHGIDTTTFVKQWIFKIEPNGPYLHVKSVFGDNLFSLLYSNYGYSNRDELRRYLDRIITKTYSDSFLYHSSGYIDTSLHRVQDVTQWKTIYGIANDTLRSYDYTR